jgi:hypothetical protein
MDISIVLMLTNISKNNSISNLIRVLIMEAKNGDLLEPLDIAVSLKEFYCTLA